jgi:hypothetical protein
LVAACVPHRINRSRRSRISGPASGTPSHRLFDATARVPTRRHRSPSRGRPGSNLTSSHSLTDVPRTLPETALATPDRPRLNPRRCVSASRAIDRIEKEQATNPPSRPPSPPQPMPGRMTARAGQCSTS